MTEKQWEDMKNLLMNLMVLPSLYNPAPPFSHVHSPIPPPSPVNARIVMDVHVDMMATPDMEEEAVLLDQVDTAIVTDVVMDEEGRAEVVAVTAGSGDQVAQYIQVENLLNAYLKVYSQMLIEDKYIAQI